jgi:hypothetical protein
MSAMMMFVMIDDNDNERIVFNMISKVDIARVKDVFACGCVIVV